MGMDNVKASGVQPYEIRKDMEFDHDKVYIVLGAPRSATSFLTESLAVYKVDMGERSGQRFYLNCENQDFLAMNRTILKTAGGSWKDIPTREKIINAGKKLESEIQSLIKKYRSMYWGFKDPRSTLTIECYLPHIEGDVYLYCSVRKPELVARSLSGVESLEYRDALSLAKEYNRRMIGIIERYCKL